ncbi:LysR family transcriptional regulator [Paroceanicella profunda]|uniref:LysR family transcriptional regulator n=1 Tax=Paroceanicella profunda TaxID=2579971 RepID=A0A5B8FG81_9RHOB|nr:LysR family transcriptional regulator [Paroceanicella profunda]QDL90807.1 LysR family transcriptional regulator [Paroceanicella profunda]
MDRLTEMEAFLRVVDQGGFTEAARKMGLSKSAVSKHVSALEVRLGARLLNRTTRRVSPTEIGLAYYDRASRVLADATEADAMVSSMQSEPKGELRVSAPVSFGVHHLSPVVADFLADYPDVSVHMVLDDRFVELVAEGFDVAIRIGTLPDSSLRAKKLAETDQMLLASQEYIDRVGNPASIDDLSGHMLLHYSNLATGNFWRVTNGNGEDRDIRAGGRLSANNGDALLAAARRGLGIVMVPSFFLSGTPEANGLVRLLPDLMPQQLGIYAIYPPGRFPQPKLRAFIDFLSERFRGISADGWATLGDHPE